MSSKKLTCKGTLRRLSEFIDWRYSLSSWYFRPSFVNCCPSNLLVQTPPPPLPYFNNYTVKTYTVCFGGGGGLRQINTCLKVPLQFNFLDDDILRMRRSGLPALPTASLWYLDYFVPDVILRVILKPRNKTEYLIPKKRFQTGSLDRNIMARACKRFRSSIEAVFAAESSFIE